MLATFLTLAAVAISITYAPSVAARLERELWEFYALHPEELP